MDMDTGIMVKIGSKAMIGATLLFAPGHLVGFQILSVTTIASFGSAGVLHLMHILMID